MEGPTRIALLGSTGSIGSSTLEIVRERRDRFELFALVAHRSFEKLTAQIAEFSPRFAALTGEPPARLVEWLECHNRSAVRKTEYLSADGALTIGAAPEVDVVIGAIVGVAGLRPAYETLKAGKRLLLANKESLVCAGELLVETARASGAVLLPVDSEHSALFQLLEGERLADGKRRSDLERLILTASGGPFFFNPPPDPEKVTPAEAIRHPRWSMGAKISVDSATLVNKALEVIEARWLFDIPGERIEVLVHPESIVHSLVAFRDGTQFAQLSVPDMKGPIAYALSYPYGRLDRVMEPLDLAKIGALRFAALDDARFPAVRLAKGAMEEGGAMPAVFNSANEVAVERFLAGRGSFARIVPFIEDALARFSGRSYSSMEDILALDEEIRALDPI